MKKIGMEKEVAKKHGKVDYIGVEIRKYNDGNTRLVVVRNVDTTNDEIIDLLTRAIKDYTHMTEMFNQFSL